MNLNKLLILNILIFVNRVSYCIDVLSKFHQSDYKIRDLRLEVTYVNKKFMHEFSGSGHKYNRIATAFNGTFKSKIDLENKVECIAQAYKRASNEYRLFPMRFQINLCRTIASNVIGLRSITNYGNYSHCNWKKDTLYYFSNFPADESHLPPFMPSGEFKVCVDLLHGKNQLGTLAMYAEVYRPEI